MKKFFCFFLISCVFSSLFSFTQRYDDTIEVTNNLDTLLDVTYQGSIILDAYNSYSKILDLGERTIWIRGGSFYNNNINKKIISKKAFFVSYPYDYTRYYKMGWFGRFLLITEELIIEDEDGNIILTLETLTPEDFEVTESYGIVEADLIIDESTISKFKERQQKFTNELQQYTTNFNIKNESGKPVNIEYSLSSMLTENTENQTFSLDLGTAQISINPGLLQEQQNILLKNESSTSISNFSYDYWKFNKMGWFAQFMITTGEFVVKDEKGNVLLDLNSLTLEDFEVIEKNGITTATLVIKDKI